MKDKLLVFPIILILIITSIKCKTINNQDYNSDLIIQAGFVCGWGSGTDSLTITKETISYSFYIPRIASSPQLIKSRPVTGGEWSEITGYVNVDEFTKLIYNTCNVCFDGCDEWIFIRSNQQAHKITFGKGESINVLSKLQAKLSQLRSEFNN